MNGSAVGEMDKERLASIQCLVLYYHVGMAEE